MRVLRPPGKTGRRLKRETGATLPTSYEASLFPRCCKYAVPSEYVCSRTLKVKHFTRYFGNVYFEPLRIVKLSTENPSEKLSKISTTKSYPSDERLLTRRTRHWCAGNQSSPKDKSPNSRAIGASSRMLVSLRQLSILDKNAFLSRHNQHLSEDLIWISCLESFGSLRTADPNGKRKKRSNCTTNRFHQGLVSTTLKDTTALPLVDGSKYIICDTCALRKRFA